MATQWQTFPIPFTGGLITNISPLQQGINNVGSANQLQNFEPSLDGGYKKVAGYTKFINAALTGSGTIKGLAIVQQDDNQKVIAVRGGTYFIANATDSSPAWASLGTASNTSFTKVRQARFNFSNAYKICFVDGVNFPAIYDRAANSLTYVTSSTSNDPVEGASHVCTFKSTMFYGVGTELIFSAPFAPTDFTSSSGAGSISIGSEITGLIVFRDQLIIFALDKIMRLTGNTASDFTVSAITEDLGCLSADTIQEVGADVMFLGPDGLRTLSSTDRIGDFGIDVASKNIRPTVNKLQDYASSFCSIVIRAKAQYRLFAYVDGEQSKVAKGVLGTKFIDQGGQGFQWATLQGFKVNVADSQFIGEDEFRVFANNDGYVYKMDQGTSLDGESIDAIYESPFMPINDPQLRKTFYKLDFYIKPSGAININAGIRFNQNKIGQIQPSTFSISDSGGTAGIFGDNSTLYNTAKYGAPRTQSYKNQVVGSGETVAIRIEDKSADASFLLDTAIFEFATDDRQ
tara:strand:+ start:2413 stop:3960 length:1548 start_codon:yes stop_codon:yes gene_type:complete